MICAEAPSPHQRKSPMHPGQNNVRGHFADDAWIMPVAWETRVGFMAIGEERGSTLHVGVHECFDRRGGIVGNGGETNAARTRVEIFGMLASWLGLIGVALDHLERPYDEDFSSIAAFKKCIAFAEGNFGLIDFDNAFQWFAIWIHHRAPEFLSQ